MSQRTESSQTSHMRGTKLGETPRVIHAARPSGSYAYISLCDSQGVVPMPGFFDPSESGACPRCRELTT